MREIKFRVWDVKRKEMIPYEEMLSFNPGNYEIELFDHILDYASVAGKDAELMQYTGLKDKNGKEVYEGDIVRCDSRLRCPHEVVWMEEVPSSAIFGGMPGFYLSGLNDGYAWAGGEEVIGNVWENPELLKGDSDG